MTLENVTFHSNNAFQISIANGSSLSMRHTTVVDTVGGNGELRVDSGVALVESSIVRGNCQTLGGGLVGSLGGNVESPGSTCFFVLADDRDEVDDPGLTDLGGHGGPTRTFDLLDGSPARALVSDEECAAHDQRGVARSPNPSESCDAGAVESFDGRVSTPLFLDGFQSGTAGVWSDAAP